LKKKIEEKKKKVEELLEKIKSFKTLAILDLNKLPAKILQDIRKKKDYELVFEKKSILARAIKKYNREIYKYLDGQKMLILSNLDPISFYKILCSSPIKRYAKAGEIAEEDIVVPAGETNLPPGPVLSELKQAKIDAKIAGGKIVVANDSLVAKKGEKISSLVASALQKLDIKPFEIKVNIPIIYDGELIYKKEILKITDKEILDLITRASSEALSTSIFANYPSPENIRILLVKCNAHASSLAFSGKIFLPELVENALAMAGREAKLLSEVVS
jgi:large subunit ribosomal protein L10